MSGDLVAFLRARLDEDEAAARAIRDCGPWRYNPAKHWRKPGTSWFEEAVFTGPAGAEAVCVAGTGDSDHPEAMARAAHIARWDPARVLVEVEAKRAILSAYVQLSEYSSDPCESCWAQGLRQALGLLALPYSDHPDYQQGWAP